MFSFLLVPLAIAAAASADSVKAQPAQEPVTIQFDNQSWELATVYAVPDHGLPVRLGQVTAGSSARLVVPRNVVNGATTVNVVATRLARRGAIGSGPVTVSPGESLSATLSSNGLMSILPGR